MSIVPTVLAATAAVSGICMYLDAKFSVSNDISQILGARRTSRYIEARFRELGEDDWSFYHVLHQTYGQNDDLEALAFEGRSWTYRLLREEVGRLAAAYQDLGIRNRTVVGMFVNNSPEFLFSFYALIKIGAIPAPLNTSMSGDQVKHCLNICSSEFLLTTYELYHVVAQTFGDNQGQLTVGSDPACPTLAQVLVYDYDTYKAPALGALHPDCVLLTHRDLPSVPGMGDFPPSVRPKIHHQQPTHYMFTSGTTGLPKAIKWPAVYAWGLAHKDRWPGALSSGLRFYICMPMFHGTATFVGVPPTWAGSGTVILSGRFSRSRFWHDVRRNRANGILYIGEMLRYLTQSPPDPEFPDEKDHGVKFAFGLGLSPKVWKDFRDRFGVPWIIEYYGSSEGTTGMLQSNKNDLGVGKVARWGPLMRSSWIGNNGLFLIKINSETGEVYRDPRTGFCLKVGFGEPGEAICRVQPPIRTRHNYIGPGGEEATRKKILKNVFQQGDEFFRMGDSLAMDKDGFISFVDRLGDTYRVKGHNISTTEVENVLSRHPAIASVIVYAIAMNRYGYEGQLGCIAVTLRENSSTSPQVAEHNLATELEEWLIDPTGGLPPYAVPRFLRFLSTSPQDENAVARTSSTESGPERVSPIMKKQKFDLQKEGFNLPLESNDRIYWIKQEHAGYVPLDTNTVQNLLAGRHML